MAALRPGWPDVAHLRLAGLDLDHAAQPAVSGRPRRSGTAFKPL
ncbi:MAG: hypothetical protein ACK4L4_15135 [Gemmobacter sp.]